jgi:hypothetical protein
MDFVVGTGGVEVDFGEPEPVLTLGVDMPAMLWKVLRGV